MDKRKILLAMAVFFLSTVITLPVSAQVEEAQEDNVSEEETGDKGGGFMDTLFKALGNAAEESLEEGIDELAGTYKGRIDEVRLLERRGNALVLQVKYKNVKRNDGVYVQGEILKWGESLAGFNSTVSSVRGKSGTATLTIDWGGADSSDWGLPSEGVTSDQVRLFLLRETDTDRPFGVLVYNLEKTWTSSSELEQPEADMAETETAGDAIELAEWETSEEDQSQGSSSSPTLRKPVILKPVTTAGTTATQPAPPTAIAGTSTQPAPPTARAGTSTQPAPPTARVGTTTQPAPPTARVTTQGTGTSNQPPPPTATAKVTTTTQSAPPTAQSSAQTTTRVLTPIQGRALTKTTENTVTDYNLFDNAQQAQWRSGSGVLSCPGSANDNRGFVRLLDESMICPNNKARNLLETHPQWVADGWIEGRYPIMTLGQNVKFKTVGAMLKGADNSNGVMMEVIVEEGDNQYRVIRKRINCSEYSNIEADLSRWGGKKVQIILRVSAGKSSTQDWAVWVHPRLETE